MRSSRSKGRVIIALAAVFLLLIGLGFILYPFVAIRWSARNQTKVIETYQQELQVTDARMIQEELKKAQEYNDTLHGNLLKDPFVQDSGKGLPENYRNTLNIGGIMGVLSIPVLEVELPVYHGTGEESLQKGVGHLHKSSLPIGGLGNHSVLTGHSALASAKLFSDLEELELGDLFYLDILGETMAYEVDQITVVVPEDISSLQRQEGKDLVTLVTCTPYAINSHRLLVRGSRIPYIPEPEEILEEEAERAVAWILWVIPCLVVPAGGLLLWMQRLRKRAR